MAGSVEAFDRDAFRQQLAQLASVSPGDIELHVSATSVRVTSHILVLDQMDAHRVMGVLGAQDAHSLGRTFNAPVLHVIPPTISFADHTGHHAENLATLHLRPMTISAGTRTAIMITYAPSNTRAFKWIVFLSAGELGCWGAIKSLANAGGMLEQIEDHWRVTAQFNDVSPRKVCVSAEDNPWIDTQFELVPGMLITIALSPPSPSPHRPPPSPPPHDIPPDSLVAEPTGIGIWWVPVAIAVPVTCLLAICIGLLFIHYQRIAAAKNVSQAPPRKVEPRFSVHRAHSTHRVEPYLQLDRLWTHTYTFDIE